MEERDILAHLPQIRQAAGDRAVLRALHFYADDRRVDQESEALKEGNLNGSWN